jgi:hypothetical protein
MNLFALVPLVLFAAAQAPSAPSLSDVPGVYELLVCKGPCGFHAPANVVVKGTLVLAGEPFTREALDELSVLFSHVSDKDANACFAVKRLKEAETYAGLIELGLTAWSVRGNRLSVELYSSSDAWHFVSASLVPGGFEDVGRSDGVGAGDPNVGSDIVKARRVGRASAEACVRAALAK